MGQGDRKAGGSGHVLCACSLSVVGGPHAHRYVCRAPRGSSANASWRSPYSTTTSQLIPVPIHATLYADCWTGRDGRLVPQRRQVEIRRPSLPP